MKELTIEQKAQRYDEAIEEAEMLYKGVNTDQRYVLESLFPELAEIEDVRIRKAIIKYFSEGKEYLSLIPYNKEECIAWIEKQGEQKSTEEYNITGIGSKKAQGKLGEMIKNLKVANKVKPKFKANDWITNGACIIQITSVDNKYYWHDKDCVGGDIESIDKEYHLWTIQDAKDGDVLIHNSTTFIFKGIENGIVKGICTELSDTILNFGEPEYDNDYCPATKEQRDTLMKVMTDAGYTFDFEKKELKEIEQSKLTEFEDAIKDMMDAYRDAIGDNDTTTEEVKKHAAYLLSLIPHKPAEWSEEDDYNLQCLIAKVNYDIQKGNVGRNNELIDWLKSLKQRIGR